MYVRRVFSAVAAGAAIVICLIITWFTRNIAFMSLALNLSFLALMLVIMLLACVIGFRRLTGVCKGLQNGIDAIRNGTDSDESSRYSMFQNDFLDTCFQQYRHMSKNNPDTSCDIRNFINEDAVETYVHRGLLELIPDIFTSLGILGTFLGLVIGLQGFDPSGYEQMAGSVTPLIDGIKVAFITSIYGMTLSLAFSFHMRSEFSSLTALMDEFLDTYYLHVRPPYEVDSLSKLLGHQKDQEEMAQELTSIFVQQMSKSFEQAITPAFTRMTANMNHLVTAFTDSQEQVLTQVCESVLSQTRKELASDFSKISKSVAELEKSQKSYVDFMDRSMMRMQQTFLTMQEHMQESEQYSADSMKQLSEAQREAYRITQEQKATYQEYIRFMYQTIENFSAVWEKNSEKMQQYSDEIASMGPVISTQELKESLHTISDNLADLQKRQLASEISAELNSDENLAAMLTQTMQKLDDLEKLVSAPRLFRRKGKPS